MGYNPTTQVYPIKPLATTQVGHRQPVGYPVHSPNAQLHTRSEVAKRIENPRMRFPGLSQKMLEGKRINRLSLRPGTLLRESLSRRLFRHTYHPL